jgi:hypothetical protein
MALVAGDTTSLVPWFLRALALAALLGPVLMVVLRLQRRRTLAMAVGDGTTPDTGDGGDTTTDAGGGDVA